MHILSMEREKLPASGVLHFKGPDLVYCVQSIFQFYSNMRLSQVYLTGLALFATSILTADGIKIEDIKPDKVSDEIENWVKSGNKSDSLKEAIKALTLPTSVQKEDWKNLEGIQGVAVCKICQIFTKSIVSLRKGGTSVETISQTVFELCTILNLQAEEVCRGIVKLNGPVVQRIVDWKSNFEVQDICATLLQNKECPPFGNEYEWTITVDDNPPKKISVPKTNKKIKIVHISDIHYDPLYEANGNADCGLPICCRHGQNSTNTKGKLAGYWGDFNGCDTPWYAIVDALNQIKKTHTNFEHIYFTGDIVHHGFWETSDKDNLNILVGSYELIRNTFPDKKVYPVFGNHEANPFNVYGTF